MANAKKLDELGGAVSRYTSEIFLAIIERHAKGELMLKILREPGMPDWATFYRHCCASDAPEDLCIAYARAHEAYALHRAHDADEIADTQQLGVEETVSDGPKGQTTTRKTADVLGHRTLQVKTRQWLAERIITKLANKNALQNPDGSPLATPVINLTVIPEAKAT